MPDRFLETYPPGSRMGSTIASYVWSVIGRMAVPSGVVYVVVLLNPGVCSQALPILAGEDRDQRLGSCSAVGWSAEIEVSKVHLTLALKFR